MRRPSLPTVVAFVALFVALDGPAHAARFVEGKLRKGSVGSREVDNRSLALKDLRKKSVRKLRRTPNSSVSEAKLRNGAVTPGKLAPGAVTSGAVADRSLLGGDLATGSVGGLEIADGSLTAPDLGRFWGRFRMNVPSVPGDRCWSGAPAGLPPEQAGADISEDLVLVTPGANWPDDALAFTVQNDGDTRRFVITACNVTGAPAAAFEAGFRYLIIDLP